MTEPASQSSHLIKLADWLIDCRQQRMIDSAQVGSWQDIPVLSFNLINALIQRPNEILSSDELMQAVWGNRVVSDENLQQRVRMVRKMLGESNKGTIYIETVRGKGYRLIAPLERKEEIIANQDSRNTIDHEEPVENKLGDSAFFTQTHPTIHGRYRSLPIIIRIIAFLVVICLISIGLYLRDDSRDFQDEIVAVLPFTQKSELKGFESFNDGLTEQVIQSIATHSDNKLIAYSSVSHYEDTALSFVEISQALASKKLIVASLDYQNTEIQVHLKLIDGKNGDTERTDLLMVKLDNISRAAEKIAEYIHLNYLSQQKGTENREVKNKNIPHQLDIVQKDPNQDSENRAYALYLKGRQHYLKYNQLDNAIAEKFFRESLSVSPAFALSLCGLADSLLQSAQQYEAGKQSAEEALRLAEAAVNLSPNLAEAHKAMGFALDTLGDFQAAIDAYQKAIDINPSYADALLNKAVLHWEANDIQTTYELIDEVIRIDPLEPFAYLYKAKLYSESADFESARRLFARLSEHHADNVMIGLEVARFHFDIGEFSRAEQLSNDLLKIAPQFVGAKVLAADSALFKQDIATAKKLYNDIAQLVPSWEARYALLRLALIDNELVGINREKEWLDEDFDKENPVLSANINRLLVANALLSSGNLDVRHLNSSGYDLAWLSETLVERRFVDLQWLESDPHLAYLRQSPFYIKVRQRLISLQNEQRIKFED